MNEEEMPIILGNAGITVGDASLGVSTDYQNALLEDLLEQIVKETGIAVEDILGSVTGVELAQRLKVSQSQITRGFKDISNAEGLPKCYCMNGDRPSVSE